MFNRPVNGFLKNKSDPSKTITLMKKEKLTHDVRLFRWKINDKETLGILPGEHVKLFGESDSKQISRFYSPVSNPDQLDYFEVVIKIYSPTMANPKIGLFTTYLDSLNIGDKVQISGPFGQLGYINNGYFLFKKDNSFKRFKKIAMIAGGSGLTPMLQLIRHVINENDANSPLISLIYTNKTPDDVIVADELQKYSKMYPSKFNLTLTFTRYTGEIRTDTEKAWKEHLGRIDEGLLAQVFPYPDEDVLVLICGPKDMNATAKTICTCLGYTNISVF